MNIFVIHTPFQLFVAEQIIKGVDGFQSSDNVLVAELLEKVPLPQKIWKSIHYLPYVGGSTVGQARNAICEKNVSLVRSIVTDTVPADAHKTRIFLSDIAWPMNNVLFFDQRIKPRVEFSLLIDGIGSYTGPKITVNMFLRNFAKSIVGRLGYGVAYKTYCGFVLGDDQPRIKEVFGFRADMLACEKEKQVDIPIIRTETPPAKSRCLFLDQPYWRFVDDATWRSLRENTLIFLSSLGCISLHYKGHHMGRAEDVNYYHAAGFEVLNEPACIEQLLLRERFETVVSYNSSALFNLKNMHGEAIRCISLFADKLSGVDRLDLRSYDQMLRLFASAGVEIVAMK